MRTARELVINAWIMGDSTQLDGKHRKFFVNFNCQMWRNGFFLLGRHVTYDMKQKKSIPFHRVAQIDKKLSVCYIRTHSLAVGHGKNDEFPLFNSISARLTVRFPQQSARNSYLLQFLRNFSIDALIRKLQTFFSSRFLQWRIFFVAPAISLTAFRNVLCGHLREMKCGNAPAICSSNRHFWPSTEKFHSNAVERVLLK